MSVQNFEKHNIQVGVTNAERRFQEILVHELKGKIAQTIASSNNIAVYKDEGKKFNVVNTFSELDVIKAIPQETHQLLNHVPSLLSSYALPYSVYEAINRQKLHVIIEPLKVEEIWTDNVKLSAIITNLLTNAFKYGAAGKAVGLECSWCNGLVISVSSLGLHHFKALCTFYWWKPYCTKF